MTTMTVDLQVPLARSHDLAAAGVEGDATGAVGRARELSSLSLLRPTPSRPTRARPAQAACTTPGRAPGREPAERTPRTPSSSIVKKLPESRACKRMTFSPQGVPDDFELSFFARLPPIGAPRHTRGTMAAMRDAPPLADRIPPRGTNDPDEILGLFLDWVSSTGLTLYPAQEEALLEIMAGKHVILGTPTGPGSRSSPSACTSRRPARGRCRSTRARSRRSRARSSSRCATTSGPRTSG